MGKASLRSARWELKHWFYRQDHKSKGGKKEKRMNPTYQEDSRQENSEAREYGENEVQKTNEIGWNKGN